MKDKKTLYIILAIVGIAITGGLIWYFTRKPADGAPPMPGGFTPGGGGSTTATVNDAAITGVTLPDIAIMRTMGGAGEYIGIGLDPEKQIPWKEWVQKYLHSRGGIVTATQAVESKINMIKGDQAWLNNVQEQANWYGLDIESNLVWNAIFNAKDLLCVRGEFPFSYLPSPFNAGQEDNTFVGKCLSGSTLDDNEITTTEDDTIEYNTGRSGTI